MSVPTPAVMARRLPRPRPRQITGRRLILLDAIRRTGGRWTTGRVQSLYALVLPSHVYRSTIRVDLRELCAAGHLVAHGGDYRRYYTLPEPTAHQTGSAAERSAEPHRACPVDDGSAEGELHRHVTRRHGGRYGKASTTE
ncbi:hypothetical protein V2S66_03070 [Streptomyces sp. V4-01]|uniref:DUF2087 domain-containing protein n=1 Tax=Actinacidiphila polyblastidii TaxID=3110430 RepID=A0ABU7P562_9ACTN|nr:hypothetical protein [Streptomyces sp. V4-01]